MKPFHDAAAASEVRRQHGVWPAVAAVTMPMAGALNDAVAVDLSFLETKLALLHIIDKFSRSSRKQNSACGVRSLSFVDCPALGS